MTLVDRGPDPIHCPATHDCSKWSRNTSHDAAGNGHSSFFHEIRDEMIAQFWTWIDDSISCLRDDPSIRHYDLPNPSDPTQRLPVGIVDPTTVVVLLGFAQVGGHEATGAYVGLAAQDMSTGWKGLTGFFVPWCPGCYEQGDAVFKSLREGLASRSVTVGSAWDLPSGLWSRRGWFDDDRLQLGGFVVTVRGVDPVWTFSGLAETDGPALVATGPTTSSLANVILVPSLSQSADRLRRLRPAVDTWTVKRGPTRRLAALAGLGEEPIYARSVTVDRPSRAPAAGGWWRLPGEGVWHGPVPNVWLDLRDCAVVGKRQVEVVHLPEFTPVRLSDICALEQWTHK